MNSPKLSWLFLIVLPILSLFIVFLILYFFSNIKVSTNFVYFENAQYSSQNALSVVDNRITYGESEGYKSQKKMLEDCKLSNPDIVNNPSGLNCESKFGLDRQFYNTPNLTNIYLYDVEKESSKLIDLETAKSLVLVPERKNESGESFENANCGGGGSGFLFGGYSGYCGGESNKITIKKNYATKTIDLETTVALELNKGIMPNGQKNIFWIKK
jgi:hypothetical protein